MGSLLRRIKIASFVIILVQIILVAAFVVFYFNNLFNLKSLVKVDYAIIGACSVILIDSIFVWINTLVVSSVRQKTDLHAAEVIGNDVQEAYNFAMIGLAVTDEKNIVIWTNDIFKERHIDLIDVNILDWHKELISLKENNNPDNTIKIVINSRTYEIKFLAEAGLWIFKDITEYESIYSYSRSQAPVVGILEIDNYGEVIKGDDDFNDIVTKVKNVIFTYFKEYSVLLRKIKDDCYSLSCNYDSFHKMQLDRFSIIDKVREASAKEETPLTLSIGLARDFPDVIKLNELAKEALDIAMSRGGDQVVVNVYGSEMEFYGGKTEAQEKRNRVKTRVLADSLFSLLRSAKNVLIMGHTGMDLDALGACLGIKCVCDHYDVDSYVVADLKNTEVKTRSALTSSFSKDDLDKLIVSPKASLDMVTSNTLLVVVDVHIPKMTMFPELLDKCPKVVVIDHHRRAEEYIENPVFNHIDAAASSTCELVAEFVKYSSTNPRVEIPAPYATLMLAGIFLDTSYYKSKNTGIRTFEASTVLKEFGADNSIADDFLKDDFEEHKEVNEIINELDHPQYGIVIACGKQDKIYDSATISKACNACLCFKGTHAAFVIGKTDNKEIKISARSDGTINVSVICEKLGGGGHYTSSAAIFNNMSIAEVKESLTNALATSLKEATATIYKYDEEEEE